MKRLTQFSFAILLYSIFVFHSIVQANGLTWNTFLGGTGSDSSQAIATDSNGNIILTGSSNSSWGSPKRAYSGGSVDAFVAKLDSSGNLLWNTFLGTGSDHGQGVTTDSSGNIIVTGYSEATWGSPKRAYSASSDVFVAKLDSNGNLLWNTFLGGTDIDDGHGVATDSNGNIIIIGESHTTWGIPLRAYSGSWDAFVAKLDNNGNFLWHLFLGSSARDYGYSITTDSTNNIIAVGYSLGTWGSPKRAYDAIDDTFVVKLNTNGSLIWNTFLGGPGIDQGYGVVTDSSDNIIAAGYSSSSWGSPKHIYNGSYDAFVAKLDFNGNLFWNTFLGSSGNDYSYGVAADNSGNIDITGSSSATWGNPDRAFSGSIDAYTAKLDASGNFYWNTFLGALGADDGKGIATDTSANIIVTGTSNTTWGSPKRVYTGGDDTFVAKLLAFPPTPTPTFTPSFTVTPTPTITKTVTITSTATPTCTFTLMPTLTVTPTPTISVTFTPTSTITPMTGFKGKLLDEKYTYFAPHPVQGDHFNFVVHVPRACELKCNLYTTSHRFVLGFNMACSGPGEYEHREFVGNLANGVYLLLVKAESPDGTKERLIKKMALLK